MGAEVCLVGPDQEGAWRDECGVGPDWEGAWLVNLEVCDKVTHKDTIVLEMIG